MTHNIRAFKIQWNILVLLLVLLAMSIASNVYLYFDAVKPSQEGGGGEETETWIRGWGDFMWDMYIKLTPNRAVFDSDNRQFNVSVRVSDWSPFEYGWRNHSIKIHDENSGKLVAEKILSVYKSEDENYWPVPILNLTVTLDVEERGINVYSVEGWTQDDTFPEWICRGEVTFAVNLA